MPQQRNREGTSANPTQTSALRHRPYKRTARSAQNYLPSRRKQRRRIMWQATWVFVLYAVGEVAILVAQYFNTAAMEWLYLLNILIRALICTALTMLSRPVMQRMLLGRDPDRALPRNREVKSF